jgi:hypothetical protein
LAPRDRRFPLWITVSWCCVTAAPASGPRLSSRFRRWERCILDAGHVGNTATAHEVVDEEFLRVYRVYHTQVRGRPCPEPSP